MKQIINHYIKEKELDIFFEKLLSSYTVYEKDNINVENILNNIKELVGRKLTLLINIIFNRDQINWFVSLKIKDEDNQSLKHYGNLIDLLDMMLSYNVNNVPEKLIQSFSQGILSTPELNIQINKLVLKYFG